MITQRKPQRLFTGLAGSPLATVQEIKPGRSRKYPEGTTASERMKLVREEQKQKAAEKERQEEITTTTEEQTLDKKTGGAYGPGRYVADAPQGKGELVTGFGGNQKEARQIEDVSEASVSSGLSEDFFPDANQWIPGEAYPGCAELDWNDLGAVQKKIDESLASPNCSEHLRTFLENSSLLAIQETLCKRDSQPNIETTQGKRTTAADADEIATLTWADSSGASVNLNSAEQAEVDECFRKLRNDEQYCKWFSTEDGGEYICQLCWIPFKVLGFRMIGQHYVQWHPRQLRQFFKEQGVPYRRNM
jgi:hypothetical protein